MFRIIIILLIKSMLLRPIFAQGSSSFKKQSCTINQTRLASSFPLPRTRKSIPFLFLPLFLPRHRDNKLYNQQDLDNHQRSSPFQPKRSNLLSPTRVIRNRFYGYTPMPPSPTSAASVNDFLEDKQPLLQIKDLLLGHEPPSTIAVAESLTSGRLQSLLGDLPDASKYFRGGLTAYALDLKTSLLGIDPAEAEKTQGVSASIAKQMAVNVCEMFEADIGLATTGFATPCRPHQHQCEEIEEKKQQGEGGEKKAKKDPSNLVIEPHAYWALADCRGRKTYGRGCQVMSARVEGQGTAGHQMEQHVANIALLHGLLPYLENLHSME